MNFTQWCPAVSMKTSEVHWKNICPVSPTSSVSLTSNNSRYWCPATMVTMSSLKLSANLSMQVSKKGLIFLSVSTRVYNPWTSFCLTVALGMGGGQGRYACTVSLVGPGLARSVQSVGSGVAYMLQIHSLLLIICTGVKSWRCGCPVAWFCYQLM